MKPVALPSKQTTRKTTIYLYCTCNELSQHLCQRTSKSLHKTISFRMVRSVFFFIPLSPSLHDFHQVRHKVGALVSQDFLWNLNSREQLNKAPNHMLQLKRTQGIDIRISGCIITRAHLYPKLLLGNGPIMSIAMELIRNTHNG